MIRIVISNECKKCSIEDTENDRYRKIMEKDEETYGVEFEERCVTLYSYQKTTPYVSSKKKKGQFSSNLTYVLYND